MSAPSARLLDTLVGLVAEQGLEAVSIRRVAAAAGVSIGAVQHHFPSKDAMLVAALEHVGSVLEERLGPRLHEDAPADALRAVALELAALTPGARPGTAVWLAFVARACSHAGLAELHERHWRAVEDLIAGLLAAHRGVPAARAADDAAALLALLDGLAVAAAVEPARMPTQRARALLQRELDRLLAP